MLRILLMMLSWRTFCSPVIELITSQISANCERLVLNFEGFNWTEIEGVLYLSSKDLSIKTGKEHFHVLEKVRKYLSKIDTEFSSTEYIIENSMILSKFGVVPVRELEVKENARGGYASEYLLNQTATLALMAGYDFKLQIEVCDFFIQAHQYYLSRFEKKVQKELIEEQKALKEARKTNAETIMVKLLDIEKNIHYHKFVSVTKPVDYDAKLQGQYVRALMSARSALEKLKEKGYDVPTIYRKRILRSSDITGWGDPLYCLHRLQKIEDFLYPH